MCPMSLLLHLQTLTSAMTLNSLTPVTRSASTLTGHTSVSVDMGMDGGWTGIAAMVSVNRRGGEGRGGGGEGRGGEGRGGRGGEGGEGRGGRGGEGRGGEGRGGEGRGGEGRGGEGRGGEGRGGEGRERKENQLHVSICSCTYQYFDKRTSLSLWVEEKYPFCRWFSQCHA